MTTQNIWQKACDAGAGQSITLQQSKSRNLRIDSSGKIVLIVSSRLFSPNCPHNTQCCVGLCITAKQGNMLGAVHTAHPCSTSMAWMDERPCNPLGKSRPFIFIQCVRRPMGRMGTCILKSLTGLPKYSSVPKISLRRLASQIFCQCVWKPV
jgi:hypothetical protein